MDASTLEYQQRDCDSYFSLVWRLIFGGENRLLQIKSQCASPLRFCMTLMITDGIQMQKPWHRQLTGDLLNLMSYDRLTEIMFESCCIYWLGYWVLSSTLIRVWYLSPVWLYFTSNFSTPSQTDGVKNWCIYASCWKQHQILWADQAVFMRWMMFGEVIAQDAGTQLLIK